VRSVAGKTAKSIASAQVRCRAPRAIEPSESSRTKERLAVTQILNALVTGASSGLGRELVRQLVIDRGMTVLATARRLDRLEALAAELPAGRVEILAGELTDEGFRKRLWNQAEAMSGGVGLLVNNAGMGNYSEFVDQDPEAIRRMFELNVIALIDLSQKAARSMKSRGSGQILQISSVLGFIGLRDSAVYVATKHAVNGLVKSLRYELEGTGVRVWAACPGRTASEFRQVALGVQARDAASTPHGELTDKVVKSILRGLDRRTTFLMPGWRAWTLVTLAHWLPWLFDLVMTRLRPSSRNDALAAARGAAAREAVGEQPRAR
jgi:short-subunit dehydrogenase